MHLAGIFGPFGEIPLANPTAHAALMIMCRPRTHATIHFRILLNGILLNY